MSNSHLENLPNEIILKVFAYLNFQELLRCGQVSKRIRSISHDETLQVTFSEKETKIFSQVQI